MVDLNRLIPPASGLQLTYALAINDRGEIAGIGVPSGISPQEYPTKGHAYILLPCDSDHTGVEGCDYDPVDQDNLPEKRSSERRVYANHYDPPPYRSPGLLAESTTKLSPSKGGHMNFKARRELLWRHSLLGQYRCNWPRKRLLIITTTIITS